MHAPDTPVGVCRKWLVICVLKIKLFKISKIKYLLMSYLRQTPTGGVILLIFQFLVLFRQLPLCS